MAKYCKTCDIPLLDTTKFCPRCGTPAQGEICAQCGAELPPGGKFCAGCGTPRQASSSEAPSLPPEPAVDAKSPPPYSQPASPQKRAKRQTAGIIAIIASGLALVLLFVFVIGPNIPRWTGSGGQTGAHTSQTPAAPAETLDNTVATYKDPEPESVFYSEVYGYIPVNQLIVVFEDSVDKAAAKKTLEQIGGAVVGELEIISLYQLETDFTTEAELTAAMDAARALAGVELVFPNTALYLDEEVVVEATTCSPLRDPVFEDEDNAAHYKMIGMENAWAILRGSGVSLSKVNVGVLDYALYTGSDEFKGKVKVTGDTTDTPATRNGQTVNAGMSHGTLVTHVIGADEENGGMVGIASILGENLEIDVKNLFDSEPFSTHAEADDEEDITQMRYGGVTHIVKALVYLKKQVDDGNTVINCSYGPGSAETFYSTRAASRAYKKFFEYMQEKHPKVVFVAGAGNDANADQSRGELDGLNHYPGGFRLPNVITVGSLNIDGTRANSSNFAGEGGEVTLSAPGVQMVLGVDADGRPIKASGTSYATPQVTAAVALIKAVNPDLSAEDIKKLLVDTAQLGVATNAEPGKTGAQSLLIPEGMGAGVLRVDEAVLKAINDLRGKNGQKPYTMQQLLDMATVRLTAVGEGKEYALTARIPAALSGSTDVRIEVTGEHTLEGEPTQSVQAGGEAAWNITLEDDSVAIRVVRLDNSSCARMTLTATGMDISGIYTGTSTTTVAESAALGEVTEHHMKFTQNDDGTVSVIGVDAQEVRGSYYNQDTGEFYYEKIIFTLDDGREVKMMYSLKFTIEDGVITAKGTITIDQTGSGWTQEAVIVLKKTAD